MDFYKALRVAGEEYGCSGKDDDQYLIGPVVTGKMVMEKELMQENEEVKRIQGTGVAQRLRRKGAKSRSEIERFTNIKHTLFIT